MPITTERDLLNSGLPLEHLKIGECIVTRRTCIISTVLGSCVSVVFHDPGTGLSGMFHAMLPLAPSSTDASMPGKFVDSGIRHVMDNFDKAGVQRSRIRVKLFGGAYSMKDASKEAVRSIVDVGAKNVAVARERLAELGLPVLGEDVLGGQGRKVLFHTGTGDVWVRFLKHMDVDPALFRARTA